MEAGFKKKDNELELKKMEREKKLNLQALRNDLITEQEKQKYSQELDTIKQNFANAQEAKKFQLEKMHTELTLQKYQIDSMERVYKTLNVRNMSINQFSGADKDSIGAIMPALGFGAAQIRAGNV